MRILVAIDGSECSNAAVEEVAARNWPPNSTIEVVSVVDLSFVGTPPFAPVVVDAFGEVQHALTDAAEEALKHAEAVLHRNPSAGLRIESRVIVGPPGPIVCDEAATSHADLVVVGSHGKGAVKRLLLGSVSTAVALHAPCSVEIVRRRPSPAP